MATEKQIEANRRNAHKSTGPNTDEGKQISKMNAVKHGLTAETVVIKDEDPEAFDLLRNDLIREFAPETTLEFQLVDRVASTLWRLRRVPQIEASLMEVHRLQVEYYDARNSSPQRSYDRTAEEEEVRQKLIVSTTSLGRAFIEGATSFDTIGKLSRYEAALVGMLNMTFRQLDQERSRRDRSAPTAELVELKALPKDQ